MKNIKLKISLAALTAIGATTVAIAGQPAPLPEPSVFGLFAAGVVGAIIAARIIRKK